MTLFKFLIDFILIVLQITYATAANFKVSAITFFGYSRLVISVYTTDY